MKQEKTRKGYEIHLNQLYADSYGWEQVQEQFSHLNVKKKTLLQAYQNHELGTLTRKYDPIAFNTGYSEWHP